MNTKKIFLTVITLIITCLSSFSQEIQDTVYLTNGQFVIGKIIGQNPDKSLKIKSEKGNVYHFQLSDISFVNNHTIDTIAVNSVPEIYYQQKYEQLRDSLQLVQEQKTVQKQPEPNPELLPLMSQVRFNKIYDKDMLNLMSSQHEETLYRDFRAGMSMGRKGHRFINAGIIISAVGTGIMFASTINNDAQIYALGLCSAVVGEVLLSVGIPISIVSGVKRNKTKDAFYNKYFSVGRQQVNSQVPTTLQLNLIPNGVGLTLNFQKLNL